MNSRLNQQTIANTASSSAGGRLVCEKFPKDRSIRQNKLLRNGRLCDQERLDTGDTPRNRMIYEPVWEQMGEELVVIEYHARLGRGIGRVQDLVVIMYYIRCISLLPLIASVYPISTTLSHSPTLLATFG